jgi:drug/metabolite transporter (DMT)-like permease
MFLALPFLALINFYYNGSKAFKLKSRRHLLLVLIASLAFAGDMSSWHWSLEFTSVANATIFVNTASIYMVIFAVLIFKEPISKQFILSFVLTFVGVIGLIYFSNIKTEGALLGDGIALMAAFLYATYLLIISRLGEESSINIIFYTTLFTGMFGLAFALFESRDFLPSSSAQFYNLLAMAILCQVGGQFFITYSLPKIKASLGSIGLLMQPIIATIFGAIVFYEYLNFTQLSFVILALLGIYFARLEIKPNMELKNETQN